MPAFIEQVWQTKGALVIMVLFRKKEPVKPRVAQQGKYRFGWDRPLGASMRGGVTAVAQCFPEL